MEHIILVTCVLISPYIYASEAVWTLTGSSEFAAAGESFTLTCNPQDTSGFAKSISWSRSGTLLANIDYTSTCNIMNGADQQYQYTCEQGPIYKLTIPANVMTNSQNNIVWRCNSVFGGIGNTAEYTLTVAVPVSNVIIDGDSGYPNKNVIHENTPKTFTCITSGCRPKANITVTTTGVTDGQRTERQDTQSDGLIVTIVSQTITATRGGVKTIQCSAVNIQGRQPVTSETVTLDVYYVPSVEPTLTGYTTGTILYEGDNDITLTCQQSGGYPLSTINWSCEGKTGTPNNSGTLASSYVQLKVDRNLNGKTCTCTVQHPYITSYTGTKSVNFTVYYPPSTPGLYPSPSTPFPWIEAGQGTLNCLSQPGNQTSSTYQWIRENVVIPGQTEASLILTSLTKNDYRKSYQCKVSNDYTVYKNEDLVSQPRLLDVEFSAIFNSSMKFFAELNGTVEVKIPFFCNPSAISINNISIAKDNIDQKGKSDISLSLANTTLDISFHERVVSVNGQEIVLTFHSFTRDLQGTYTAGVKNLQEVSVSTFVFEVVLSGPPGHPKDFKLVTSIADSVILSWIAGNNGGLHQTFVISYKQTGKNDTLTTKNVTELKGKEMYLAVIADLLPNTEYSFWIYAYNSKGNSIQNIESTKSVTGKTILQEIYDKDINYNNDIGIGIVIGMIVGGFSTGLVVLILLWRKGIWNGIKCISGDASENQLKTQDENTHKDIDVYDGINPLEEDVQNNQDSVSNQEEYEDLRDRQDSPAYQELHNKGAEAIQLSSIYMNTIVK